MGGPDFTFPLLLPIAGALAFLEGVALLFALNTFGWAKYVGTIYKIYGGKFYLSYFEGLLQCPYRRRK